MVRWIEAGNGTCPVGRDLVTIDSLKSQNRMTKQLLNKLVIRCKNHQNGCPLMCKLEYSPQLNEHELNLCAVTQKFVVREIQEKHKEETNELKKKISEVKEALSLEKSLHLIDIEDKDKVIEEKEKRITDLEDKIDQLKRKSTELLKIFQDQPMQSLNVAKNRFLEATGKYNLQFLSSCQFVTFKNHSKEFYQFYI